SLAANRAAKWGAGCRWRVQYAISPAVNTRCRKRSPCRSIAPAIRPISVASRPSPMMVDIIINRLPQPTDPFEWVQAPGGPALVCRPLRDRAAHLFTTRGWRLGIEPSGDGQLGWNEIAAAMHVDSRRLARLHQVHGAHAVVAAPEAERPDADIAVSQD